MLSVRRQHSVHAGGRVLRSLGVHHLCSPILVSAGSLPGEASSSLRPSGHRTSRNVGTASLPSGLGILPPGAHGEDTGGVGSCQRSTYEEIRC